MELIDIALWISAILFGSGIAFIIYGLQTKAKNETLKKENELIKRERTIHLNKPRDITADKYLIHLAQDYKHLEELRIIGINSLGVIHQAREDIMHLLKKGKTVKLLLLNPISDEFINRIRNVECRPNQDFESHYQRLKAEWNATIMILRNIRRNINKKNLLKIKVRNENPSFAFTATVSKEGEECIAYINEYPLEGRGTRGEQYSCRKSNPSEKLTYESKMHEFNDLWMKANTISIDDEKWIL